MTTLDIRPDHLECVIKILKKHLLSGMKVYAFGSRATWQTQDSSDLDLAIDTQQYNQKNVHNMMMQLAIDFEESLLPWKVDLLNLNTINAQFKSKIEKDMILLPLDTGIDQKNDDMVRAMSFDFPDHWQILPLEDVMEAIIDYRGKTPTKTEKGIPLITAKIVKGGRILEPTEFIAVENYDSWMVRGLPEVGDIVVTSEAPLGEVAQLTDSNVALAQRIVTLRGKKGVLNNDFLLCAMQSSYVQHQLESRASGSTVKGIKQSELRKVLLPIPDEDEQLKIAHHIKCLSNKIELNRQTNQTLEQIAQALFKSWFVDFEPTRAKIAAKEQWLANHSPLEGESKSVSDSVGGNKEHQQTQWHNIKRQYTQTALNNAKTLRTQQTDAEGLLWHYLRNKQLGGFKFRRQQAIGNYIADFACMPQKLIIELDGSQHGEQQTYDKQRDGFLKSQGFTVLRFWNHEVFGQCFDVLEKVYHQLVPPAFDPSLNQTSPNGLSSSTLPQGEGDLEEAMNLAAMAAISGKSIDALNTLNQDQLEQIKTTAALFPDALIDSELGEIPEGWVIKPLSSWGEIICGKTPSKKKNEYYGGNIPFIKIPDMHGKMFVVDAIDTLTKEGANTQKKKLLPKGSICVSCIATVGQVVITSENSFTNQQINSIVPENEDYKAYLYFSMVRLNDLLHDLASGGSATLNLNTGNFSKIEMIFPQESVMQAFSNTVSPMLDRILSNMFQNQSLELTRDVLLPKLLSGELDVQTKEVDLP